MDSTQVGVTILIFFVIDRPIDHQILQPVVYGRTVRLSPLIGLIAVLVGPHLAARSRAAAIPVTGLVQVILSRWLKHRRGGWPMTPTTVERSRRADPGVVCSSQLVGGVTQD